MSGALIARLEAAEKGSRELDAMIWAHFQPEAIKITGWNEPYGDTSGRTQVEFTLPPRRTRYVTDRRGSYVHAEPVTTSIDAALSLAERVLPGMPCELFRNSPTEWGFHFADQDTCYAPTPALALCAAILRAKEPQT